VVDSKLKFFSLKHNTLVAYHEGILWNRLSPSKHLCLIFIRTKYKMSCIGSYIRNRPVLPEKQINRAENFFISFQSKRSTMQKERKCR
jgi:hypothetical protein